MFFIRTFMLSSLLLASAVAAFAQADKSAAQSDAAITISISTQGVGFTALGRVGEMRLEVFNSLGETVFTHLATPLTSQAALDWNLRAGDGEPLAAGLYSYVLTLKVGEEQTRQHRGNLIIERDRQQVWLTAQDGATVSGTFTRSGERSLAGFRMSEDKSVKRDMSGRELLDEKGNQPTDAVKAAKQENAALLGTVNRLAKFDTNGTSLIDSAVTDTGHLTIDSSTNMQAPGLGSLIIQGQSNKERVELRSAGAVPGPALQGKGFGGTIAAPTATLQDTDLFIIGGSGHNGSALVTFNAGTVKIKAAENWTTTANGSYLNFETTPLGNPTSARLERMRITGDGKVGIGTSNPQVKLDVVGDVQVTGNAVVSGNIAAKYQDVAEWVPARQPLIAGTVVSLDATRNNAVVPSARAYDTHVAGVVSAQPGVILGEGGEGKALVATTGRVKVKVDATRHPIKIGDLLVTSGKSGLAMKSQPISIGGRGGARLHRPGTIIGKALEPLAKGRGEILVLLSLQ